MAARSLQRGNAMVEFVLIATVLTPIFMFTPVLTKTADANLSTAQAARYGAWEQTVQHKGGDKLATEINNRFYAKPDMAIRTKQGAVTGDDQQNQFWAGAGVDGRMVNTAENETLSVAEKESSLGGAAGVVGKVVATLGNTIGAIVPDSKWGLGAGGIHTVNVGLKIDNAAQISEGEQGENCQGGSDASGRCMRQKSAILVDTWGARGPDEVADRVRSLVPAGALEPLGDVVALAGVLPFFQELKKLDGVFGEVKPDILPPDRYGDEDE